MLRNIVEVEPQYVVEGDALWPYGVRILMDAYPGEVKACFLGYGSINPKNKLLEIRDFPGRVNDWIQGHTDEYILELCEEMIAWSQFLEVECNLYGIPYIDVSRDFLKGIENAYQVHNHPL